MYLMMMVEKEQSRVPGGFQNEDISKEGRGRKKKKTRELAIELAYFLVMFELSKEKEDRLEKEC